MQAYTMVKKFHVWLNLIASLIYLNLCINQLFCIVLVLFNELGF